MTVRSPVDESSTKATINSGDLVDTIPVTGRADLTDVQWAVLEPLLPKGKKPGRPPKWTRRQLIDGIRWRTRAGAPWRDVPDGYGPWESVYGRIVWEVSVDSTVARAHQHAAGARKRGICRSSRPAGWTVTSRPITRWAAPAVG